MWCPDGKRIACPHKPHIRFIPPTVQRYCNCHATVGGGLPRRKSRAESSGRRKNLNWKEGGKPERRLHLFGRGSRVQALRFLVSGTSYSVGRNSTPPFPLRRCILFYLTMRVRREKKVSGKGKLFLSWSPETWIKSLEAAVKHRVYLNRLSTRPVMEIPASLRM